MSDVRVVDRVSGDGVTKETIYYRWDNAFEFFQNWTFGSETSKSSMILSPDQAVRMAKMILEKYEGK